MEKYIINYNTGAGNQEIEVNDLSEAKEIARKGMTYTQMHVNIETIEGNIVTQSRWESVVASDEDIENGLVLEQFGTSGYYVLWTDELENL